MSKHPKAQNAVISAVIFVLYNWYLGYCLYLKKDNGGYEITEFEWCDGLGFLLIITGMVYLGLLYFLVLKPFAGPPINKAIVEPIGMNEIIAICKPLSETKLLSNRKYVKMAFKILTRFVLTESAGKAY